MNKSGLVAIAAILLSSSVCSTYTFANGLSATEGNDEPSSADIKGTTSLIRIVAGYTSDALSFDPFVIYYQGAATYNFDSKYDALKLANSDINVTNFSVYSLDNKSLSISAIPEQCDTVCTFPLRLKTEKSGEVIIKVKDITGNFANKRITLTDKTTGVSTNLSGEAAYVINLAAGTYDSRFTVTICSITTSVNETSVNKNEFRAYSSNGTLYTEFNFRSSTSGKLMVIDLNGRILFTERIDESGSYTFNPDLRDGVYIISFTDGKSRESKKIFFSRS